MLMLTVPVHANDNEVAVADAARFSSGKGSRTLLRLRRRQLQRPNDLIVRDIRLDAFLPLGDGATEALLATVEAAAADQLEIIPVFRNPVMELVRLLREAANIEHALAVQYLYGAYSLKPPYSQTIGGSASQQGPGILGVAIQEMHHLSAVNTLLLELGGSATFQRQDFPVQTEIYPFEFHLERLSLSSLAKYLVAESPPGALDPATAPDETERRFRRRVQDLIGAQATNQIGSLYRSIIGQLDAAVDQNPQLLADPGAWRTKLENILVEGERTHFEFFKSLFTCSHPALGDPSIWNDENGAAYPSRPVPTNPTALEGSPRTLPERHLPLAKLGNLHYWAMLTLLHQGFVASDVGLRTQAVQFMKGAVEPIAAKLASVDAGMPFDIPGLNFEAAGDATRFRPFLRRLLEEIIAIQVDIDADLPPLPYRKLLAQRTIELLGG